jgi:hypothetical protein
VGYPRRHQQPIGAVAVQHHALGAIQHPVAAVPPRGCRDIGDVVARLPFDMRERQLQLALHNLRDQRLLLLDAGQPSQQTAAQDNRG